MDSKVPSPTSERNPSCLLFNAVYASSCLLASNRRPRPPSPTQPAYHPFDLTWPFIARTCLPRRAPGGGACDIDCAANALGIDPCRVFIVADVDRRTMKFYCCTILLHTPIMKFSFHNGTDECIVHGPAECGNLSDTAVEGWGYFGVFDGSTRRVWARNSTQRGECTHQQRGWAVK